MVSELVRFNNVQEGLRAFRNDAPLMQQNLETRLDSPVLKDKTNIWQTYLDSRTMQLYGGVNQDNRQIFKIDHDFDLDKIVDAQIQSDGSIQISQKTYHASEGTEFVVIEKSELKGAAADYAIRADNYEKIREFLNKGEATVEELELAGGFEINETLDPGTVKMSDGWLELAVGKNKASKEDYAKANDLIKRYVSEAKKRDCFSDNGKGMGFYVEKTKDTKARSWYVNDSGGRSGANDWGNFHNDGHLLRVRDDKVGEADALKIDPSYKEAYQGMVKGENILHTPQGDYVLAKGRVK